MQTLLHSWYVQLSSTIPCKQIPKVFGKKSQLRKAKVKAQEDRQDRMCIPYVLYACLSIYNKFHSDPQRSDVIYTDSFIYSATLATQISSSYTGNIQISYDTLDISSNTDMFWFQTSK